VGRGSTENDVSPPVIGTFTTYTGEEHPYLRGTKVRIIAVMKGAARADYDADEGVYLRDDDALAAAGGLTVDDRVEVVPWIDAEQRWCWTTSDARAVDLSYFKSLAGHRVN
jgi:hypothetical protein